MRDLITTVQRFTKEEVEAAVREKVAEGWEVLTPILPKVKANGAWKPAQHHTINDYEGSHWDIKYFCNLKKSAPKRIGILHPRQSELIKDQEQEIIRLEARIEKLRDRARERTLELEHLKRQNASLHGKNGALQEENAKLQDKVRNLSSMVSNSKRRANIQGLHAAVIRVGKKDILLGTYDTAEMAEEREKEAYEAL